MTIALLFAVAQGAWSLTTQNALAGSGTETDPYLIGSVNDWCTLASSVEAGNTYANKVFKMTADINLGDCQVMIGTSDNPFGGNFDGQGHTLTIHYVSTEDYCAPFRCIMQNEILLQNLHVTGTINTSGKYAGGIIGRDRSFGTTIYFQHFHNLWSSVEITSTVVGEGFHGGLAGRLASHPNFINCLFDGSLLGTTTTKCGGMLGLFDSSNYSCYVQSCIYNPKEQTVSDEGSATFVVGGGEYRVFFVGESYWPGDALYMRTLGEAQGKDASAMDKTDLLNALGGEWQLLDDGQLVPLMPVAKPLAGSGTEDDPYIIGSADDWTTLKDNVMSGRDYRSKYFRQTSSFTTSEMVGTMHHPFTGMYDGGGNTITFNIGSSENPSKWTHLAPFRYTKKDDKTEKVSFSNIHTDGDIYTEAKFAAGLIAYAFGPVYVTNCRSSVSIHSSVEDDGTHGGFISHIDSYRNQQNYYMTGCVFDGRLLGEKTTCWGGFIGWQGHIIFNLTDCLFIPQEVTASSSGSKNFFRCANDQYFITLNRSYYNYALHNTTREGKRVYSLTSARNDISFSMGTPKATYKVSGIRAFDNGIIFDDTLYPSQGATVTIDSPLKGYRFTCDGDGSSISGSKLTMGNANTTVDATLIDWETEYQGTQDNPYLIQNTEQMNRLAERVNASSSEHYADKYFELGNDIDYDGTENNYTPVGCGSSIAYYFGGHFDGKGHRISGVNINVDNAHQALFGVVNGGTVRNLTLASSTITSYADGIAGIVGYLQGNGTLDNCHVASTVSVSGRNYVGGIVGSNTYGTISNSSSGASVSGTRIVGGIVGGNGFTSSVDIYCTIKDNIYCGTSVTGSDFVGAIAGNDESASTNHVTYSNNYYTAAGVKGVKGADVTDDDGAVPALRDDADNASALELLKAIPENVGAYSIRLNGRTLYTDNSWNTLCLPFDLSADQLAASPLADADIRTLSNASFSNSTLKLDFEAATTIEAGKPYIIKWTSGSDIANPSFTDVTINDATTPVETKYVDFVGTYSPIDIFTEDKTNLYLGANDKLYYPTGEDSFIINSFRAFFQLKEGLVAGELTSTETDQQPIRAFVLNFGEETGIREISTPSNPSNSSNPYFTLDGRRLGKPSSSGLYIHNGRKVLIK